MKNRYNTNHTVLIDKYTFIMMKGRTCYIYTCDGQTDKVLLQTFHLVQARR